MVTKKSEYPSEVKLLIGIFGYLYKRKGEAIPLQEIKDSIQINREHNKFETNFDHAIEAIENDASFILFDNNAKSLLLKDDANNTKAVAKALSSRCWKITDDVLRGTVSRLSNNTKLKKALVQHFSNTDIPILACSKGGTCYVMAKEIFEKVIRPTKLITANFLIICEAMKYGIELIMPSGMINFKTAYIDPDEHNFHKDVVVDDAKLLSDIYADVRLISFRGVYLEGGNLCFAGSAGVKDEAMVKACLKPKPGCGNNVVIVVDSGKIAKTGDRVVLVKYDTLFEDNITYTLITDIEKPSDKNYNQWEVLNKFLEIGDNTSIRTHQGEFKKPIPLGKFRGRHT